MDLQRRQAGFTYIGVLVAVVIMSIGLAAVGELWSATAERQRKQQLDWMGEEFVQAIGSYYYASPPGNRRFPPDLQALLADTRFPFMRRHLRRIYLDPYSATQQWGTVPAPDGGVMGIYSLAAPGDSRKVFAFTPLVTEAGVR
ncbi:type II secretion system GspH family protein [Schlegelella sp. S2-27]|uniref:Type II secretion system GspH family protein n=1 Tax=Caldimonas mangrovi TaxID=2944811 RepID=A0ABT0YTD1_9BURK|nr:type II secretion system protein [Caldimonas mangrovi]MCM5681559.1 type II secretion system GspH family protein [Caldimonas mangrovi]